MSSKSFQNASKLVNLSFADGQWTFDQPSTAVDDLATVLVDRRANHAGGTPGFVNAGIFAKTFVSAGNTNFEWAITGVCDNSATAGENLGGYFQGIKRATGPTWGMTAEARDTSSITNPTTGLVGIEVDTFANGFDANNNRVGIDVVIGKDNQSGSLCETAFGIRIGTSNADITQGRIKNGVSLSSITFDVGFDTSSATQAAGGVAYRMAATQKLSFTALNDRYMSYTNGILQYQNGGTTPALEITDSNEVRTFSKIKMYGLPTASSGLSSGDVWRNGSVLNIVP
jgi:hypothetical protein